MDQIINGIRIHYEVQGDGEPLVFVHGLGSSTLDWEEQLPEFAKNYKVISLDLRGHGESEKPPGPYSMSLFADDVFALLNSLGVDRAHFVGHSLGGMICFQFAVNHSEKVKSLTIVNSMPEINIFSIGTVKSYAQRQILLRTVGLRGMAEVMSRKLFPEPKQRDLRRKLVRRFAKNDIHAYLASLHTIRGWSVYDELGKIKVPVLVISAKYDYWPPSQKEEWLGELPNAEMVIIDDSRHVTQLDQPAVFNQTLSEFLETVSK